MLDQHHQLNLKIEEEVIANYTDMDRPSQSLIRANTLLELTQMKIPSKKLWLISIHLAVNIFVAPAYQSDAYADEQSFMLNWFT